MRLPVLASDRAALFGETGAGRGASFSGRHIECLPSSARTLTFVLRLYFHYSAALPPVEYESKAYITPRVKLELGARGDPWATEEEIIRPYAADDYATFFDDPDTSVIVLSARRTF